MCFIIFSEKQELMNLFIQYLHLNLHSFLPFHHVSGSSLKAIMPLSATLPLAIGLIFCFLIALLLYPKSAILAILGLYFLDPKDLCLPNQLSRGSLQKRSVSTYLTWCQRRNWHFMLVKYEHFLTSIFFKVFLVLLNWIEPILEGLKENITKPPKPWIIGRYK